MDKKNTTGIVLAGGGSTRMGKDKGMIKWKGRTLCEHAIETLSALCENIVISANLPAYDDFGYPVIRDKYKDGSPMVGIFSCLHESESDLNLVIPVDTPLVSDKIYQRLLQQEGDYDIVFAVDHQSRFQPLCAVFHRSILPSMEEQIRKKILGFTPLIEKVRIKKVPFNLNDAQYDERTFYNVNTQADLEAIS